MLARFQRAVMAFAREIRYGSGGLPPDGSCHAPEVRAEFAHLATGGAALQKLLDEYEFKTVLDVGSGAGEHSEVFLNHGKTVTAVDYGRSKYFEKNRGRVETVLGDFHALEFPVLFDCVWASHVLEHQPNAGRFLAKIASVAKPGGIVCITVPPPKPEIVGGHLSFWNGGLLLYNMVLAGFDCREARVCRYGYNISVIVANREARLPELTFDSGDIDRIVTFLPPGLAEGFNGDIWSLRW